MNERDFELHAEETHKKLVDVDKKLQELDSVLSGVLKVQVENPTEVQTVEGKLEVNTEKAVEVTNLEVIHDAVKLLAEQTSKTIADTYKAPPDSVTVKNIAEAKADTVKVNNIVEFSNGVIKALEPIIAEIAKIEPTVVVEQKELTLPTNPKNPIAVRLSDGKSWINQLVQGVASGVAETDPLVGYQPCDIDEAGTPKYYGFAKNNGAWYIMRESSGAYRYTKGAPQFNGGGLYSDAWTDRANLTYDYIFEVFKK